MYIFIKLNCRVKKDYVSLELPVQLSFCIEWHQDGSELITILQWINHLKFYEAVRTEYTYTALLYLTNQLLYFLYYTTLTIYWMLDPFWLTKLVYIYLLIPLSPLFMTFRCDSVGIKEESKENLSDFRQIKSIHYMSLYILQKE